LVPGVRGMRSIRSCNSVSSAPVSGGAEAADVVAGSVCSRWSNVASSTCERVVRGARQLQTWCRRPLARRALQQRLLLSAALAPLSSRCRACASLSRGLTCRELNTPECTARVAASAVAMSCGSGGEPGFDQCPDMRRSMSPRQHQFSSACEGASTQSCAARRVSGRGAEIRAVGL
jgi:hypothetical protein